MDELEVAHILKNQLGFKDSSIKKIKKLHNHLLEYNKRYNLISKNTENSIWFRHILDSAQLIKFIDFSKVKNLVDFGSGAGFPGLIIGIYAEDLSFHVKLYEKSKVKREFLINMKKNFNLKNVSIKNNVYEKPISTDVIVCRAFKKLKEILIISREIVKKPHKLIVLKGKNAQAEIDNALRVCSFKYKLITSVTDEKSKILLLIKLYICK